MRGFLTVESAVEGNCVAGQSQLMSSSVRSEVPSYIVGELTEVFKMFDLNGDGKISKVERGTVVELLGETLTEAELERMINEVDADGDGEIDLQEFIALNADGGDIKTGTLDFNEAGGDGGSSVLDALKGAFTVSDADKNGFISAEELHRVLASLGDKDVLIDGCRYMISCVDRL